MSTSPQIRAGDDGNHLFLSSPAPESAPRDSTPVGAARGQVEPRSLQAPARSVPAAELADGGPGSPSRNAVREGTAGPMAATIGPAQSPATGIPPYPGAARGEKAAPVNLPAPSRAAPAASPPVGGRGTRSRGDSLGRTAGAVEGRAPAQTAPPSEGSPAGAGGGIPVARRRAPGGGVPPAADPVGGRRSDTSPPAAGRLRGKDAMRAWQDALSDRNATARRGRGSRPDAASSPAVGRLRVAPPRPEAFDDEPPPPLRIRRPEPPDGDAA